MEGPPEKRRTFRENGLWHGRSPGKAQDLPGKWLLAWKVPREKRRTFRENGPQRGRAPHLKGDLGTKKRAAIREGPPHI